MLQRHDLSAAQEEIRDRRPSPSIRRPRLQAIAIPAGYTDVPAIACGAAHVHAGDSPRRSRRRRRSSGFGLLPAHRLRRGTRGHLHALRFPDDPVHRLVLLNRQTAASATACCRRSSSASGIVVLFTGLGVLPESHRRTVRRGAARQQPLGERIHRAGLRRLRIEPAGRV